MKIVYISGLHEASSKWEERRVMYGAEGEAYEVVKAGAMPVCIYTIARCRDGREALEKHTFLESCDALLLGTFWEGSEICVRDKAEAERLGLPVFEDIESLEAWLRLCDSWPPEVYKEIDDHERSYQSPVYPCEAWLECVALQRWSSCVAVLVSTRGGKERVFKVDEGEAHVSSIVGEMIPAVHTREDMAVLIKVHVIGQDHTSARVGIEQGNDIHMVEVDPSLLTACTG